MSKHPDKRRPAKRATESWFTQSHDPGHEEKKWRAANAAFEARRAYDACGRRRFAGHSNGRRTK